MKKRTILALILVLLAVFVLAAPASTTVYITKTGEKYHASGCRSLAKSKIAITLGEAVERGYEPCKVCDPPTLD